jgi:hypothetical protein
MAKLERLVIGNQPATEREQPQNFASGQEAATEPADATLIAVQ